VDPDAGRVYTAQPVAGPPEARARRRLQARALPHGARPRLGTSAIALRSGRVLWNDEHPRDPLGVVDGRLVAREGSDLALIDPDTGRRAGGCAASLPSGQPSSPSHQVDATTALRRHGGQPYLVARTRTHVVRGIAPMPGEPPRTHTSVEAFRLDVQNARCTVAPAPMPDFERGPSYELRVQVRPSRQQVFSAGRSGASRRVVLGRGDASTTDAQRTADGHHAVLVRRAPDHTIASAEVWNVDTGARVGTLPALGSAFARGVAFAVVGSVVLVAGPHALLAHDLRAGRRLWRFELPSRFARHRAPEGIP
jgi:hypothetical protein